MEGVFEWKCQVANLGGVGVDHLQGEGEADTEMTSAVAGNGQDHHHQEDDPHHQDDGRGVEAEVDMTEADPTHHTTEDLNLHTTGIEGRGLYSGSMWQLKELYPPVKFDSFTSTCIVLESEHHVLIFVYMQFIYKIVDQHHSRYCYLIVIHHHKLPLINEKNVHIHVYNVSQIAYR